MATDIDALQIKINSSARGALTSIDTVVSKLDKLNKALDRFGSGSKFYKNIQSTSQSLKILGQAFNTINEGKINNSAVAIRSMANSISKMNSVLSSSNTSAISGTLAAFNTVNPMGASNLITLSTAINKFGGVKVDKAAESIAKLTPQLTALVAGLNGIGGVVFDTTSLVTLAESLNKLGGVKVTQAVTNIASMQQPLSTLQQSLSSVVGMGGATQEIATFAEAVNRLGNANATRATTNIGALGTALSELFVKLQKAPRISQNIIDMTNALAALASQGGKISSATAGMRNFFNATHHGVTKSLPSIKSLSSAIGTLYMRFWMLIRVFRVLKKAMDISSGITEVQNVINQTFGDMAYKVDDFVKTSIQKFGMSEYTVKSIASTFQAMGTALGYTRQDMADMSLSLTELTADMASFYNVEQKAVAEDLRSIFTGTTKPLRAYGIDLSQATLKEYALSKGLDANFSAMTQAEKAALRYQYVLDRMNKTGVVGDFARTSNTWANQVRILTNNFQQLGAVIGGALINALKPVVSWLNVLIAKITQVAKVISTALGAIFGWTYETSGGGSIAEDYEDAAGAADDLASGTGKAADNAKKLKNNLLGIDELNIISPEDDSSKGGGGGAGGGGGLADEGGWERTEGLLDKMKSGLNNLWELGRYISDTLADVMERIDWEKIFRKAEHFGKGLANFLNGLITPRLFGDLGETIANALNTRLHFLDSFGETFAWKNFGNSLATGLNRFFATYDFGLLARTINVWVQGIFNSIITFIEQTDWYAIGYAIGEGIAKIDWFSFLKNAAIAIWKGINGALDFYVGIFNSAPIATAIASVFAAPIILKGISSLTLAMQGLSVMATSAVKAFGLLKTSFKYIQMFGAGNFIAKITNSLSSLQKGAIGVVAVFGEFLTVSNAVHDIANGTDHLGARIGQLTVGIGAATAALTVAFGIPAGIAIAGVTAAIAALTGYEEAMHDLDVKSMEESIYNAFANPNGVPLEDLVGHAIDEVTVLGDTFGDLQDSVNGFEDSEKTIQNLVDEIGQIKAANDANITSTEETAARLVEAYSNMADAVVIKMQYARDILEGTFTDPIVQEAMEGYAINADEVTRRILEDFDGQIGEYQRLKQAQQEAFDAGNMEEVADIQRQIDELRIGTGDLATTFGDLEAQLEATGLSMESFYDSATGTWDVEGIVGAVGQVATAVENANEKIDTFGETVVEAVEMVGDAAVRGDGFALWNQAMEGLKGKTAEEALAATDALQSELIDGAAQIMSDAHQRFLTDESLQIRFNNNWEAYAQEELWNYYDYMVEPVSKGIEESFGDLREDGAGWASDAFMGMMDAMFSSEYVPNTSDMVTTLNTSWEYVIDTVAESGKDYGELTFEGIGEYFVEGLTTGIKDNSGEAEEESKGLGTRILEGLRNILGIHSPSTETYDAGGYFVEGFANGVKDFTDVALDAVTEFSESIKEAFMGEDGNGFFGGVVEGIKLGWEEFMTWWSEEAIPIWMEQTETEYMSAEVWQNASAGIKTGIETTWTAFVTQWKKSVKDWFDNHVKTWFSKETWTELGTNMSDGLYGGFKAIVTKVGTIANGIIDVFNMALEQIATAMNDMIEQYNDMAGVLGAPTITTIMAKKANHVQIPSFEAGGFVDSRSLFWAGEGGNAELLGTVGGKTAVAGGDEITGIRQAVYDSSNQESALLQMAVSLLQTIADKDTSVNIGDDEIAKASIRGARNIGLQLRT